MSTSPDNLFDREQFFFRALVALLCLVPPVLAAVVAGSTGLVLLALPAFGLIFVIEIVRNHGQLLQTGALLLPPAVLAVSLGVSIRLDPIVPQMALAAMPILPTMAGVLGYAVLVPLHRWLDEAGPIWHWGTLFVVAALLGGALPGWTAISQWRETTSTREVAQSFTKQAAPMEPAWTTSTGPITDADPYGDRLFVRRTTTIAAIDRGGDIARSISLDARRLTQLSVGQLDADPRPEFVVSGRSFASAVRAVDDDGSSLWTYRAPSRDTTAAPSIDCAHLADLDGDGRASLLVGSMTGGGLRVVGPDGTTRWADTTRSVTDVTAADVSSDSAKEVLAATGEALLVYTADGKLLRTMAPGVEATALADVPASPHDSTRLVVTHSGESPPLVALSAAGTEQWRRPLPTAQYATPSVAATALRAGLAANNGNHGGRLFVYDRRSGAPRAVSRPQPSVRGVAWMPGGPDPPRLVGWTEQELVGWRLSDSTTTAVRPLSAGETRR